jgi:UDP-GlcNAc:undecaprenyl-phosphate GlcNAc-1-phosphate transferase
MPSLLVFFTVLLGLFTSLVLVPPISRLAVNIGIMDQADDRKIHSQSIPRLGGIAIFFSVLLSTLLFCAIDRDIKAYLAGGIIIFLTGLSDDLQEITHRQKFLGELIAVSVAVVIGDQSLPTLGNLFMSGEIVLGHVSLFFTIVALVGVVNAVNLIDGLDGLAGGATAIASLAFLVLAGLADNHNLMFMSAALFGASLGFLKFNTHPALRTILTF